MNSEAESIKPAESRFRLVRMQSSTKAITGFSRFRMIEPGISIQGGKGQGLRANQ
jgi:hypothetical protein